MSNSKKEIDLKELKQKLTALNNSRTEYIFQLVHGKPMIHGLAHDVFRKCGKKNCRCAKGSLHGPYPALSINKKGKQKIVMIRKADMSVTVKKSERFRYFQKTLARIRRINKEIDSLLIETRNSTSTDYVDDDS